MILYVENGAKVAALFVETYDLNLPCALVLGRNNRYFVPFVSGNIIFVLLLKSFRLFTDM